jgi:hypothetical protein
MSTASAGQGAPVWICMPLLGIALASATGVSAWNWLTLVFWYVILPLADLAIGPREQPAGARDRAAGSRGVLPILT